MNHSPNATLFFPPGTASVEEFSLNEALCVIGRGAHASVRLNDPMTSWMHTMIWQEGGQIWIMDLHSTNGTYVDSVKVESRLSVRRDAAIQIGDTVIRLHVANAEPLYRSPAHTTELERPGLPLSVTVWYGQDVPDQAMFVSNDGLARTTLSAERRVALVYVLASKLIADRQAGRPHEEQGWCTDDDVGVGVWGRNWWNQRAGRLNVLIHRVRRALETDNIDPECLEKTNGRLRLWVQNIDIAEPTVNADDETVIGRGDDHLDLLG